MLDITIYPHVVCTVLLNPFKYLRGVVVLVVGSSPVLNPVLWFCG
jgi:hypothetical protein